MDSKSGADKPRLVPMSDHLFFPCLYATWYRVLWYGKSEGESLAVENECKDVAAGYKQCTYIYTMIGGLMALLQYES